MCKISLESEYVLCQLDCELNSILALQLIAEIRQCTPSFYGHELIIGVVLGMRYNFNLNGFQLSVVVVVFFAHFPF